jgi:hypothetical protein
MPKDKATYPIELEKDMMGFLEQMTTQYDLPDVSKAMRCLATMPCVSKRHARTFLRKFVVLLVTEALRRMQWHLHPSSGASMRAGEGVHEVVVIAVFVMRPIGGRDAYVQIPG